MNNQNKARSLFRESFGGEPAQLSVAPGRVNLIGEHTDYNDGFVFPAAIDRSLVVAARLKQGTSSLVSSDLGEASFNTANLDKDMIPGWGKYPAGVAWALQEKFAVTLPNIEAVVVSDIPLGSGVSSSAALELAFAVLWRDMAGLSVTNKELAKICQTAENQFVGVNCGIMDQMASAMGRAGHALFFDTESNEIEAVPMPRHLRIVLCDTKTPRTLAGSAYNQRRAECETAASILGVKSLRHSSLAALMDKREMMSDEVFRRARHVITENQRCIDFRSALQANDLEELGCLMLASHLSLKDDYEVSSPALDAMAQIDAPGKVGCRMTGAGFGGACVALVLQNQVSNYVETIASEFTNRTGLKGEFTVCQAADGARMI